MNKDHEVLYRIDNLLAKNNVQQQELIDYLGLAKGAYSNWKRMTSNSYLSYLEEISFFFHVSPNFLVTGKEDLASEEKLFALTSDEEELIELFRKIHKKNIPMVLRIMKAIAEKE